MALRKVGNVEIRQGGIFRRYFEFRVPTRGRTYWYRRVSVVGYARMNISQLSRPQRVLRAQGRSWWWYQGEFYVENDGYSEEDVKLLLWDRKVKRQRKLERLKKEMLSEQAVDRGRRERIPEDVRVFVWKRDGGRCVRCASEENLEFDHIIPVSKGGSNTQRNVQLLCEACNRKKSDRL